MDKPFFSIIIPVYNGLAHDLQTCLESIWLQPLDNSLYEVICVDDCSTDNTLDWLYEQQKNHENLRVFANSNNIRQGGSRNNGIKKASGKYILFIDQDDYFHQGALKKVYDHLIQSDLELLIVDCTYERPGVVNDRLQHNFSNIDVMTGEEQIVRNSLPWAPWKFICLRTFIVDNQLFFSEKERIEDIDWVHKIAHYAKRTQYQPILFIHYIKNDTSTTMTSFFSKETMYSTIRCGRRLYDSLSNEFLHSPDEVKSKVYSVALFVYRLGLKNYLFCKDNVSIKSATIKNTICVSNKKCGILIRFAITVPRLYSIISNISALIAPIVIIIYRKCKYRK